MTLGVLEGGADTHMPLRYITICYAKHHFKLKYIGRAKGAGAGQELG